MEESKDPVRVTIGGQVVWEHDYSVDWPGYFHTYDTFQAPSYSNFERKLHVFLPRGYNSSHSYPVLYMNDGHTSFWAGGLANQSWNLAMAIAEFYSRNPSKELIVVAICPRDRNREYTHVPWFGADCCGLESYADCIVECIKPFIDAHYSTRNSRESNMIVGSSHGGLAAFYTAVRHSAKFGFCGAMSPSFWVGVDDATNFPTVKAKNDKRLSDSQLVAMVRSTFTKSGTRPNFYLDWGLMRQGGPHNASIEERATYRGREMADLLIREFGYQIGTDLLLYEDPLGEHREESWGKHVPRVIEWFLCGM